jgi:hypothetical protein
MPDQRPTVDGPDCPSDIGGVVRGQERDDGCDLFGRAGSSQWEVFVAGVPARLAQAFLSLDVDRPGCHGVDSYLALTQLRPRPAS